MDSAASGRASASTAPVRVRPLGPADAAKKASLHLGIALAGFVMLGIAQLYAFTRAAVFADLSRGTARA